MPGPHAQKESELDLFYRTTRSGTVFRAVPADPEPVELVDYRAVERQRILDFLSSDSSVLIIGGVSSTTKTHLLSDIAKNEGLHFFDLHSLPMNKQGKPGAKFLEDEMIEGALQNHKSGENIHGLVLDEGTLLGEKSLQRRSITPSDVQTALEKLLSEHYKKIIISGGGIGYTADEQGQIIAEAVGDRFTKSFCPFHLKPLNVAQAASLVQRASPEIEKETALKIAETYLDYFRLPRLVSLSYATLLGNSASANLKNILGIIPAERYHAVINLQLELRRQLLAAMPELYEL